MITRDLFGRYVKEALHHYYDPIRLETYPLVDMLVSRHRPAETKGQALREILAEAIKGLRPPEPVPFGRPEWLGYRIMWLRYIDSLTPSEVCQDIGVGKTTFYRHHRLALEAVANALWERYQQALSRSKNHDGEPAGPTGAERAREEAARAARSSHYEWVHPRALIESVILTIEPLAKRNGVNVQMDAGSSLPPVRGDPAILRQIVLCVLNEALKQTSGGSLRLVVSLAGDETVWRLWGWDESRTGEPDASQVSGLVVARSLLSTYGGRLWFGQHGPMGLSLCFSLPVGKSKTVLMVDDNPETIELHRRYLAAQRLVVRAANTVEEMWGLLAEARPDLIVLDVLMPGQNGWDVLQQLKAEPELATIPVVVCSVLTQPELALALGAEAVLQKPVGRERLIRAVQQLVDRQDSEA